MPILLAIIGFFIFPPLGAIIGFFIGLAISDNASSASQNTSKQTSSNDQQRPLSPKEMHAILHENDDYDDDEYSAPSNYRSSHDDDLVTCSDCGGSGVGNGYDDEGSQDCPYCGGMGRWSKSG